MRVDTCSTGCFSVVSLHKTDYSRYALLVNASARLVI